MFIRRLIPVLLVTLAITLSTIPGAHASTWIYYDDGTTETLPFYLAPGRLCAVLFTPPFTPAKLLTAGFYIRCEGQPFEVLITDIAHNDLIAPIVVTPPGDWVWRWFNVDLSGYNIVVSGDFYIAMDNSGNEVGWDNTAPDSRSYFYEAPVEIWFTEPICDFMIRAEVEPLKPVPEFSFSIPIITSIATIAYLAIRKRISRRE